MASPIASSDSKAVAQGAWWERIVPCSGGVDVGDVGNVVFCNASIVEVAARAAGCAGALPAICRGIPNVVRAFRRRS